MPQTPLLASVFLALSMYTVWMACFFIHLGSGIIDYTWVNLLGYWVPLGYIHSQQMLIRKGSACDLLVSISHFT